MRRKDREIVSPEAILEILMKAPYGVLAMCDGDTPYCIPFNYGYTDGRLYLHCAPEGRKLELIRANPSVSFTAVASESIVRSETACGWGLRYESVVLNGRASIIEERGEKIAGLNAIMVKYSGRGHEFDENELSRTLVIRIDIDSMTGKSRK
ncbi:MAG: hypothetical protein A2Y33_09190 [Spirochaetes bacterium GWF1_51_8]|nr:MAG: hypothetical protein A2Y33_09190 [Spirochaetes bacterium GWF1_51_8]